MFKRVEINNYQSHKHTVLDLHEGVNVIIGSSASGKTAIFRAINWIIDNRPLSTRRFSRWIKKDKKLIGEASATLTTKDGHEIKRARNKDENFYQVDDLEPYDAPKSQIPEEITKLLNLTSVNIQNQMDQPFLVSFSGPEVSRFLNNVIRMDIIDTTLSQADKRKRQFRKKIEELNIKLIDNKAELDEYKWLDGPASDLIDRLEAVTQKKQEIDEQIDKLCDDIDRVNELKGTIPNISNWDRVQEIIDSLSSIIEKKQQINEEGVLLKEQIEDYESQTALIPTWDIERAQGIINEVDVLARKKEEYIREEKELSNQIESMTINQSIILDTNRTIKSLEAGLPEICPLCGAPMDNSHRSER